MAIPPTAIRLGKLMDPKDIKHCLIDCRGPMEAEDSVASHTIDLSAEAVALGMFIMTGGGRDPVLVDGQFIRIWPAIDPAEAENPAFAGTGVTLSMEVTIVTDSVPSTTDQQTLTIQWAQK